MKNQLKSLALLDAIVEPEWEYRYFSYDSKWGESEEMASMRDGQGGHWFVLFDRELIGYKCISPEDGFFDDLDNLKNNIPSEYCNFINEPAFYKDEATSVWILQNNNWVTFGKKDINGVIDFPTVLEWQAEDYQTWAEEYYERDLDLESIKQVFAHNVTEDIIRKLNQDISLLDIQESIKEIGI